MTAHAIVIPTGASVSRREREAEWRDLLFLRHWVPRFWPPLPAVGIFLAVFAGTVF